MLNRSHIDGDHLKLPTIVTKPDDPTEVLDFYLTHYPAVELVTCENCGEKLCLWVHDPAMVAQNMHAHHQGWRRITFNPNHLMSSRKRLDGHIGYECDCGNDSRLAKSELGIVPVVTQANPRANLDIMPHHEAAVRILLAQKGYQATIKDIAGKRSVDGFMTERLK